MPKGFLGYRSRSKSRSKNHYRNVMRLDRHRTIADEQPYWKERRQALLTDRREYLQAAALRDHRVEYDNVTSSLGKIPPGLVRREFELRQGILRDKMKTLGGLGP